jgi:hydroxymethylglutaryl-CoA synthase
VDGADARVRFVTAAVPPVKIVAVGAALPSLRLTAGDVAAAWGAGARRGTTAVCAPDEDVLTLSWRAAERALAVSGIDPADVDGLWWGTSRPPFAEGPSLPMLGAALHLRDDIAGALNSGSTLAGIDALVGAWDAVAAGTARLALVVGSDALRPGLGTAFEAWAGAGAAALVLRAGDGPAALAHRVVRGRPVLDRYRGDREPATRDLYDPRLFREQIFLPLVDDIAGALPDGIDTWSLPDPDGRLGAAAARRVGASVVASAGTNEAARDTGCAAPLLGALGALAAPGVVAVVGYGGGRMSGVTVEVDAAVPGAADLHRVLESGRAASYAEVLRARGELVPSGETVEMAVPPGSAAFVRGEVEMIGLLGARCVDCGTVNTPPSVHPACTGCGGAKLEEVALARTGSVHTFVVNHTMPAPFVAPLPLVVVDLDDGARIMLQGTSDDATSLAIEDRVELVLRRYTVERGVPVYGFKVQKVETS